MTQERFDLDGAIKSWRGAQHAAGEALGRDDLDELESHLRDQVSALRRSGEIEEEEAFLLALRRFGNVDMLGKEFGKSGAATVWSRRFFWMLAGYLGITLAWSLAGSAGRAVTSGAYLIGTGTPLSASVAGAAVTLLTVLAVLWAAARACRSGGGILARCFHFARTNPVVTVVATAFVPVLITGGKIFTNVVLSRSLDAQSFGQMALFGQYTRLAVDFGIYALLGVAAVLALRAGWGGRQAFASRG